MSTFIINHLSGRSGDTPSHACGPYPLCPAQKLHRNPQILNGGGKRPAKRPAMLQRMGKVITVQFRRSNLPRRLLDDGWWLESSPARRIVIALPERRPPDPKPRLAPRPGHLTL